MKLKSWFVTMLIMNVWKDSSLIKAYTEATGERSMDWSHPHLPHAVILPTSCSSTFPSSHLAIFIGILVVITFTSDSCFGLADRLEGPREALSIFIPTTYETFSSFSEQIQILQMLLIKSTSILKIGLRKLCSWEMFYHNRTQGRLFMPLKKTISWRLIRNIPSRLSICMCL